MRETARLYTNTKASRTLVTPDQPYSTKEHTQIVRDSNRSRPSNRNVLLAVRAQHGSISTDAVVHAEHMLDRQAQLLQAQKAPCHSHVE